MYRQHPGFDDEIDVLNVYEGNAQIARIKLGEYNGDWDWLEWTGGRPGQELIFGSDLS